MPDLSELHSTLARITSIPHLPTRRLLLDSFRQRLLEQERALKEESLTPDK
jgi:hypothetical protein